MIIKDIATASVVTTNPSAMIVQFLMLLSLSAMGMGSANRRWRPNRSRFSGLDLKSDLNNIKQKLEILTEMNETLFLVKEFMENSTPDRKPKGQPTNTTPFLTFFLTFMDTDVQVQPC